MRFAASTVFIIGIVLLANQVHAKDFAIQPLTRAIRFESVTAGH